MFIRQFDYNTDIDQVVNVEQCAWGLNAATYELIKVRSQTFPEGSIVALDSKEKIVGYATIQLTDHISTKSWAEQTDEGRIVNTHKPLGSIVYGVGMSALPEAASYGKGVASAIIDYYYKFFVESGRCGLICLGSRLPGFSKWHHRTVGDISQYLQKNSRGFYRDPELRLYQRNGFELLWEIPEYFPDIPSLNYGAMIARR